MSSLLKVMQSFVREDEGATMIEYALLVALIALVVAAALVTLGTAITTKFSSVSNCFNATSTSCT
jgi:pilus assembly protein Flp/PilA